MSLFVNNLVGYSTDPLLETVPLQAWIGHRHSDAVLAESHREDPQLIEYRQNRRRLHSVTLQFYDDNAIDILFQTCLQVIEAQVEVNGQSLGLALVHKRDAMEVSQCSRY